MPLEELEKVVLFHQKMKELWKKWLNRVVDVLKRPAGKAVEAFPVVVESVVGGILNFLGKAVEFVVLVAFVAGLIWVWLMQKVKK